MQDELSDDPFTVAAIDLAELPEKPEGEETIEEDTISEIDRNVEAQIDLASGGGLSPLKKFAANYRAWTRRMKRFCPQVWTSFP